MSRPPRRRDYHREHYLQRLERTRYANEGPDLPAEVIERLIASARLQMGHQKAQEPAGAVIPREVVSYGGVEFERDWPNSGRSSLQGVKGGSLLCPTPEAERYRREVNLLADAGPDLSGLEKLSAQWAGKFLDPAGKRPTSKNWKRA